MKILIAVLMLGLTFHANAGEIGGDDIKIYKSLNVPTQVLVDIDESKWITFLEVNGPEIDNLKNIWGPAKHAILKLIKLQVKQSGDIRCEKRSYLVGFELNEVDLFRTNLNSGRIGISYECANVAQ